MVPETATRGHARPRTIVPVQFRQIFTVVLALILIVGAAIFILSWGDDDGETTTEQTASTTSSTTTTSTTTPTVPTPVACASPATPTPDADEPDPTDTDTETEADADDPVDTGPLVPTLGERSSVSTVGLDEVTFGLTVFRAEQAAGTELVPCDPVGECYRVAPVDAPPGISFVVTDGTIERVDITDGPITTSSGVGIGTSDERIVELFGESLERKVNDDGSVDLVFVPTSGGDVDFRVVFKIRDGVVESFRSGRTEITLDEIPCA